jgi:hypothetical protein
MAQPSLTGTEFGYVCLNIRPWRLMYNLTKSLSPLLVGTYVNSILYAVELLAVIQYHSTSKAKHDSFLLRSMVYTMFILDTASTFATCSVVYLVCD